MIQPEASGELFGKTKIAAFRSFLQQPLTVITFNWATIVFVSFFLAYGYFGAQTPDFGYLQAHLASSIFTLIFLAAILVVLGILAWKNPAQFQDSIQFQKQDLFIFLSYFAFFFTLTFSQLQFSLFIDEISYAATSHGQSLHLLLALAQRLEEFGDVPFQYMVQLVSLTLLLSLLSFYFLLKRIEWKLRIVICVFALIGGRMVVSLLGGNGSPHPPLNFIPPYIFGSIFGIADFSFKFSFFVPYTIFLFVLFKIFQRTFPFYLSYFLVVAIGTIPLLLHLSTIVEHSFWASMCFTLVLAEIVVANKINYLRLISMISIGAMMRQPCFLAIFPVLVLFIMEKLKLADKEDWLKKFGSILFPTLLFIPFVTNSLFYGTSATEGLNHGLPLERIFDAIFSGIIWISIINSVPHWWVVFIPFAFIPLSKSRMTRHLVILGFFAIILCLYYSIYPSLWGFPKYQAEYAVPIAISGMLFLLMEMLGSNKFKRVLLPVILVVILLNIVAFIRLPSINKPADILIDSMYADSKNADAGYYVLSAFPYNFRDAYDAIKKNKISAHSYSMGPTYGVFPEIMNGYSLKSFLSTQEIFLRQNPHLEKIYTGNWDGSLVENDTQIKVILLGPVARKPYLLKAFKERGWSVMGEYKNIQYGSTVVVLLRPGNELGAKGRI